LVASLAELSVELGIAPLPDWDRIAVTGICEDSRLVLPGALFVAVPGAIHDGADYIDEAVVGGAVAVASEVGCEIDVPLLRVGDARAALARLSAAFYGRPTEDLFTVGVTGTNGKTTVCHWIAHLLGVDRTTVIGTLSNERRGLLAVTTPSSPIVQRIAAEARDAGKRNLIVEASSIGLEQHRLAAIDFDVGLFTNLTRDHLDLHGTMDSYLAAKRILFRGLKETAHAVVNADDPSSKPILEGCRAEAWGYGLAPGADLRGTDLEFELRRTRCSFEKRGERAFVHLPHPGKHGLMNALAAASVALIRGVRLNVVAERLATAPGLEGRSQFFSRPDGVIAVIDFAHSPDALQRALEAVRPTAGRLFVVFGCPGQSDRGKRSIMGEIAGRLADWAILTSDNPKHEDPDSILDEIEAGVRASDGRRERIVDRAEAIGLAVRRAKAGDVVLIAGKGHEAYQIVGKAFVPYSDRGVLEELGFAQAPPARA
jgi:UDP-N-acetylmuramoyl-L-alanyl-D-glutamate--2,6-diaminopimelate ligase